ncbi:hypothetical protein SAMN05518861_1238 [Mesorhizobium sp. YR577]|nr:hypothetical protein SAMN05518861_1238 [Mesorhizobium sp. YR577]
MIKRRQHSQNIPRTNGYLLNLWGGSVFANSSHHQGDMPVLPVKRLATLRKIPGQRRQTTLDRQDRIGFPVSKISARCAGCNVEADNLWIGGQYLEIPAACPPTKMLPISSIGPACIGRNDRFCITASAIGKLLAKRRGERGGVSRNQRTVRQRRRHTPSIIIQRFGDLPRVFLGILIDGRGHCPRESHKDR